MIFFPILSAVFGIFAFPPFKIYPLGFVYLVPLFFFFFKKEKIVNLISGTFIFRITFLIFLVYFSFEPILFLVSIILVLGLPISFFVVRKYGGNSLAFFLLPILWTFWDYFAARYNLLPFMGMTIGNIFGSSPFLGLSSSGGIISLTFFAAVINSLITYLVLNISSTRARNSKKAFFILLATIALIISGLYISKSQLVKNSITYNNRKDSLLVALISNNAAFDKYFLRFKSDIFTDKEKQLAEEEIAKILATVKSELINQKIDLLILPEDMIDIEIWNDIDEEAKEKFEITNAGALIRSYRSLAKELNTNLLATFTTIQNYTRYNTTLLFNRNGELIDIYNKSHLTIASEYWPFRDWRPFYYNRLRKIMPKLGEGNAIFDSEYHYNAGETKLVVSQDFKAGALICIGIQYLEELKQYKEIGAQFLVHTSSNRWITLGLKTYQELLNNLRKIESVWLKLPVLFNGRNEMAGIVTPSGKTELVELKEENKNYNTFIGEIKIQ